MPHGPMNFRLTVVKPYYTEEEGTPTPLEQEEQLRDREQIEQIEQTERTKLLELAPRRGRGRPRGSRNKGTTDSKTALRRSDRHHLTETENEDYDD